VADVEIAHFGRRPMKDVTLVWRIEGDPPPAQGSWDIVEVPIGKNISAGRLSVELSKLAAPVEYKLTVTVGPTSIFESTSLRVAPDPANVRGVTYFQNSWKFWVYPSTLPEQLPGSPKCPITRGAEYLVTRSWDEAEKRLADGGKVLFVPSPTDLDWTSPALDTVPVFSNRLLRPAWSRMLGLWIDLDPNKSKTNALGNFSTLEHFDWQWAQLMANVRGINLDRLPSDLEPVVWAIDDWNRNYKLGLIFECAVGEGRLLVSAFDVARPSVVNPVARQLRFSLLNYIASDCFQPRTAVNVEQLRTLFFDTRIMKKLEAKAEMNGELASALIDGDPSTFVLAGDQTAQLREPSEILITFPQPTAISGLVLMPRQNHREHEGDIREYAIRVSEDGNEWRGLVHGALVSTFAPQRIDFGRTTTIRYLKLVSLSGFGSDKATALAEVAVIYAGRPVK
ncbi:MAG TPA: discoidin domain-containing protein, partial [Pyrinomonadaceae bacterium]|nr:discoidin domain-containing protein [Pyrinomonadaceae bacterium]